MKTTLYLLPGLMCNEQLWKSLTPLLEDSYELITLELPLKTSFDAMIEELAQTLPLRAVNLVGFSLGGYVASYFAVRYAHRVSGLFIISHCPKPLLLQEIQKRKDAISLVETYGFKALSVKKVQSLLEEKNQNNKALIALIQQMYVDLGKEVFKTQMQATLVRKDLFEELLELRTPLGFCYSVKDNLIDTHWLKRFAQKKSSVLMFTNESSSHMLPLERPQEVALSIEKWVKEVKTILPKEKN
jgi:pimeloyl-ACP methyl ester carboxylesterase